MLGYIFTQLTWSFMSKSKFTTAVLYIQSAAEYRDNFFKKTLIGKQYIFNKIYFHQFKLYESEIVIVLKYVSHHLPQHCQLDLNKFLSDPFFQGFHSYPNKLYSYVVTQQQKARVMRYPYFKILRGLKTMRNIDAYLFCLRNCSVLLNNILLRNVQVVA